MVPIFIPNEAASPDSAMASDLGRSPDQVARVSEGRRRAQALSRCLSRKPRRSWISLTFRHRIRYTPGRQEGRNPDPP